MERFTLIDDAAAIVKCPKGVFKQVKLYHRLGRVYVGHGGGFLRICAKFGEAWGTSHPDIKVVDIEADGVDIKSAEPRYSAQLKVVA